ncbi:hypothetical protein FRB90_005916, partial [Tulasnella sp. 427]
MFNRSILSRRPLALALVSNQTPRPVQSSAVLGHRSLTTSKQVRSGGPLRKDLPNLQPPPEPVQHRTAQFASLASAHVQPHVNVHDAHLALTLPSGHQPLAVPYIWLRDSCPCPACVHPETRQKLHRTTDVPLGIKPRKVSWVSSVDKGARWDLEVEWDRPLWKHDTGSSGIRGYPQDATGEGPHRSRYSEKWFRTWADQSKVQERYHESALEMVPWSRQDLVRPN